MLDFSLKLFFNFISKLILFFFSQSFCKNFNNFCKISFIILIGDIFKILKSAENKYKLRSWRHAVAAAAALLASTTLPHAHSCRRRRFCGDGGPVVWSVRRGDNNMACTEERPLGQQQRTAQP
jgi:hypothetical protein